MQARWRKDKSRYYQHRHHMRYCLGGPVFAGRVSSFGPPGEGAGTTASGVSSAEPGIALYNQGTLGSLFRVTVGGRSATLRQTDIGPAPWTGRIIDVTGAGAAILGGVVTDSYGKARLLPSGCA